MSNEIIVKQRAYKHRGGGRSARATTGALGAVPAGILRSRHEILECPSHHGEDSKGIGLGTDDS